MLDSGYELVDISPAVDGIRSSRTSLQLHMYSVAELAGLLPAQSSTVSRPLRHGSLSTLPHVA
jgi:hypothetical protein